LITLVIKFMIFIIIVGGMYFGMDAISTQQGVAQDDGTGMLIIVVVSIIIGCVGTHYLSKRFVTKENILKIVGAGGAGFGCFILVSPFDYPMYAKMIPVIGAGIAGAYLIRGNEGQIFSYGTGFIGAFMLM